MKLTFVISPFFVPPAQAGDDIGFDVVSRRLNDQIAPSPDYASCPYCGGKGILVRSPFDGFENDVNKNSVPATFWSNDIFAATQLYPGDGAGNGDPNCPSGPFDCPTDSNTGEAGPWNYVQLAAVVGSAMGSVFFDYDNIQSQDWGWGVFFPTDSNSCDLRCRHLDEFGGFDCPGGWITDDGSWNSDPRKFGAGKYNPGNPHVYGTDGGGGAGCHFGLDAAAIDQTNAFDSDGNNLVQDRHCQCNYAYNKDWGVWVENWIDNGGYIGPMSTLDVASCWVNNPRDMIQLQNEIWWARQRWADGSVPWATYGQGAEQGDRRYWGWNEIPVSRETIAWVGNWDAIMIKLPAAMSGYGDGDRLAFLSEGHGMYLEDAIDNYVWNGGYLVPGVDHVGERPGSYVVLAREIVDKSGNYMREFFCETWMSPTGKYQVVYLADRDICYLEWGKAALSNSTLHV